MRRYRERRLPLAESWLEGAALEAFRSFCRVWTSRYDWSDPEQRRSYVSLSHEERHELYQRFARQCRSWEATLLLARSSSVRPRSPREGEARGKWGRRMREIEEREARSRRFYDRLAGEAASGLAPRRVPRETREAFRLLGLPAGAPLDEVRSAYRRLARKHHPDRRGDHASMLEVNWAYRHLLAHYGSDRPGGRGQ